MNFKTGTYITNKKVTSKQAEFDSSSRLYVDTIRASNELADRQTNRHRAMALAR